MNFEKYASKIFAGVAILSIGMTSVMASEATLRAKRLVEEAGAVTVRDKVRVAGKYYIPAIASGAIGIASVLALLNKNTHLALAYGVGQTALRLYSERATPQERQEINTIAMGANVEGETFLLNPESAPEDEIVPWRDYISDQEFRASYAQVKWAVDQFNADIFKIEGEGTLNQFYNYLFFTGIDPIGDMGERLKWKYSETLTEITLLRSPGFTKRGIPCWILDFVDPPQYEES